MNNQLITPQFPRSSKYHPEWIIAGASGGANALWLTEWLTEALSSIFLHREFGVQVWAVDLWHCATDNLQRIRDAGVEGGVFPIHADARFLPFAAEFFDAIVSIDSFVYYSNQHHSPLGEASVRDASGSREGRFAQSPVIGMVCL